MTDKEWANSLRGSRKHKDHPLQANFERPRLHHVPQWFRLHMIRACHVPGQYSRGQSVLRYIVDQCGGDEWLDHWGSAVYQGRECFVSQPYNLTERRDEYPGIWRPLSKFSATIGLKYDWIPQSDWFPPSTTSVIFYRPSTEAAAS